MCAFAPLSFAKLRKIASDKTMFILTSSSSRIQFQKSTIERCYVCCLSLLSDKMTWRVGLGMNTLLRTLNSSYFLHHICKTLCPKRDWENNHVRDSSQLSATKLRKGLRQERDVFLLAPLSPFSLRSTKLSFPKINEVREPLLSKTAYESVYFRCASPPSITKLQK
jgi:hypothetical protein